MNAVSAQITSQFQIGLVSGVCGAAGGGIGLLATALLAPGSYWLGEEKIITNAIFGEEAAQQPYTGSALETTAGTLTEMATPGVGLTVAGYTQYGVGVVAKNPNAQFMGGILAYAGKKEFINAFKPSPSMGVGLLGAGISMYIGEESDKVEDAFQKKSDDNRKIYDKIDMDNGINVVSKF